jgi:16S rRNA (cytidine1402-2'-O)-methyltransferase
MAVPGASSTLAALSVAGLPTDRFFFEGFLPPKETQRRKRITDLARIPGTLVLFESGPRLAATLADLAAGLGAREAAVCRELTKLHEEVCRGDLVALASAYEHGATTRGEMVIVVAPPSDEVAEVAETDLDELLRGALSRLSLKDAVQEIAVATGEKRRDVYQRALALLEVDRDDRPR